MYTDLCYTDPTCVRLIQPYSLLSRFELNLNVRFYSYYYWLHRNYSGVIIYD